jgi:calcineurin-like phosphoesterase family protein
MFALGGKMSKTWFTSDTHFGHANILKYCKRPWLSVEEMNEQLISNWNSVVEPGDLVWHLGDFAMGDRKQIPFIRSRLNGRIHLVQGNHDYSKSLGCFDEIHRTVVIDVDGLKLELAHNPRHLTGAAAIGFCGHIHELWSYRARGSAVEEYAASDHYDPEFVAPCDVFNVGVDVRGYHPMSAEQIVASR